MTVTVGVGRRVALWRVRRQMTQQVFADRIGRSKSWVDKVERGVRSLDRFSVIRQVAEVLRVDPAELLDGGEGRPQTGEATAGVDAVRAALASYDVFGTAGNVPPQLSGETVRRVEHGWATYRHGDYPRLLRAAPELLDTARRLRSARPEQGADLLASAYRVTALVLIKVGEPDLAWLAADRALAAAGGDVVSAGSAVVPLAQALRALDQPRLAMAATITAADRVAASTEQAASTGPERRAVYGTLLLQAALAAASCGDTHSASELLTQAATVAGQVGDGQDYRTSTFGPAAVELAHVVAAVESGDARQAVRRHDTATSRQPWQGLPAEHRAAYLLDAARAHLDTGDTAGAARWLVDADRVAPAEIRARPSARTLVAEIARTGPQSAGVARLATALGLTR
ncbi:helix-turn-helix domain-containing protein [Solwaraspora sp. WMMA2056]|uniref:helix-turn-helix domain-containing protein n=1 Tax=Solwaraspora sp. WMMA2056 TaxID=3015161 RepID=UPI00259B8372|nr:helix-turn-helix domain-containing protein [Solwaraspora sp. WMMA2056]WJK42179.1 helix-turn-helix domain-containing protein [Solwaraspora sp. WMMA2056]